MPATYKGYARVSVPKDDFYRPMANNNGYCQEHRLVMAQSLGRYLQPWELVHHKNGIKNDNRIENLELTMVGQHHPGHSEGYRDGYTKGLSDGRVKRIQELEQRVTMLEAELAIKGGNYVTH